MTPRLKRAALAYALSLCWAVLPLAPCGKVPRTKHGIHDATTNEQIIREWWTRWPDANIGVRTGSASNLVAIDMDPRNGGDISLERLEAEHGPLPETVEGLTGGGGRHLLFQHPGGTVRSRANALGPGLDVKGDGGYVVVPPSVHPTGRRYEWEIMHRPLEIPVAPLPDWMRPLLEEPEQVIPTTARHAEEWRTLVENGADEGSRNNTITRLAGHLLRRRVDPFVVLSFLLSWNRTHCRPPLTDEEVGKIVDNIARREAIRRGGVVK
jgi:hypothetical protein